MEERKLLLIILHTAVLMLVFLICFLFILPEKVKNENLQIQLNSSQFQLNLSRLWYSQMKDNYLECIASVNKIAKTSQDYSKRIDYLEKKMDELRPFYEWELIALDIASSHIHIPDIFDCTDFSKKLIEEYKKKGYEPICIFGDYYNENEQKYVSHTWIELPIYIDATSGVVITPDRLTKDYHIIERGVCR